MELKMAAKKRGAPFGNKNAAGHGKMAFAGFVSGLLNPKKAAGASIERYTRIGGSSSKTAIAAYKAGQFLTAPIKRE
jgi:hypothetical protein